MLQRHVAVVGLCLLALFGCDGSSSTPDAGRVDAAPTTVPPPAPAQTVPETGLVHGDFTPAEWAASTARPTVASKDARSPAALAAAACLGADKKWRCAIPQPKASAASAPVIPSSWTVPNWYFDPANSIGCASDTNSGTAATCTGGCSGSVCTGGVGPVATWGEIEAHRLGQSNPQLQQSTTFHQLSAQMLNTDYIFFEPYLPNGAQAVLLGSLTSVCTIPVSTATVTAQVRGGPGTRWAVSNMCVGAAAKMLLQDTTANTWAFIDSITTGTATISQPLPNSLITTVGIPSLAEGVMSTGDAFTVWSLPISNLKVWRPKGGDVGSGAPSAGWMQFLQIADSSGSAASEFASVSDSATSVLSACAVAPRLQMASVNGRGNAATAIGCDVSGSFAVLSGTATVYGGILRGTMTLYGTTTVDGDVVVHGGITMEAAQHQWSAVFSDGSNLLIQTGAVYQITTSTGATAALWGSIPVTVAPGSAFVRNTGASFAATLLTSGTLKLGAATTGSKYSAGVWTDGITLSAANLDTDNGLQDPATGARFCNAN